MTTPNFPESTDPAQQPAPQDFAAQQAAAAQQQAAAAQNGWAPSAYSAPAADPSFQGYQQQYAAQGAYAAYAPQPAPNGFGSIFSLNFGVGKYAGLGKIAQLLAIITGCAFAVTGLFQFITVLDGDYVSGLAKFTSFFQMASYFALAFFLPAISRVLLVHATDEDK